MIQKAFINPFSRKSYAIHGGHSLSVNRKDGKARGTNNGVSNAFTPKRLLNLPHSPWGLIQAKEGLVVCPQTHLIGLRLRAEEFGEEIQARPNRTSSVWPHNYPTLVNQRVLSLHGLDPQRRSHTQHPRPTRILLLRTRAWPQFHRNCSPPGYKAEDLARYTTAIPGQAQDYGGKCHRAGPGTPRAAEHLILARKTDRNPFTGQSPSLSTGPQRGPYPPILCGSHTRPVSPAREEISLPLRAENSAQKRQQSAFFSCEALFHRSASISPQPQRHLPSMRGTPHFLGERPVRCPLHKPLHYFWQLLERDQPVKVHQTGQSPRLDGIAYFLEDSNRIQSAHHN